MNTTSPAVRPVRLTPAGRLAILTMIALVVTVWSYQTNHAWVYMASFPTTIMLFLFTLDSADVGPKG